MSLLVREFDNQRNSLFNELRLCCHSVARRRTLVDGLMEQNPQQKSRSIGHCQPYVSLFSKSSSSSIHRLIRSMHISARRIVFRQRRPLVPGCSFIRPRSYPGQCKNNNTVVKIIIGLDGIGQEVCDSRSNCSGRNLEVEVQIQVKKTKCFMKTTAALQVYIGYLCVCY